jgi:hypothetical protein
MQGRSGQRHTFGVGGVAWLGIGVLVIVALMMRRHEQTANAIKTAYKTAWKRFRSREQPARHNTDSPSEPAGTFLVQENPEEETEGSIIEAEEGDGWEEEPQGGTSAAAVEEGRSDAEGLPVEEYDSLPVSQITQRLRELNVDEIERLRDYEAENRNRRSMMQRFETRIRAAHKNLKKRGDAETKETSGE